MRLLALATVALGLALTFLAAPTPAPAQAANGLEIGLQDDAIFRYSLYYNSQKGYDQARALNVSWLRVNVPWYVVLGNQAKAKTRPKTLKYQWGSIDRTVDQAAANGMRVQLVLTGQAPKFATRNKRIGNIYPSAPRYREFVKAAATHFKGRVQRYSIWNEPNWYGWLNGPGNPNAGSTYRKLYQAGYAAVKKADPEAKVLIGETAPYYQRRRSLSPLGFLRSVTCTDSNYRKRGKCKPLKADGIAHHPYEFRHSPRYKFPGRDNVTMGTLSRMRSALLKLRKNRVLRTPEGATLPIYLTEWGYQVAGSRAMKDSRRAAYTKQAFDIARRTTGVRQLLQYQLVNPPAGTPGGGFNTGIVRSSGSVRAPYKTLRAWAKANRTRTTMNPLYTP